MDNFDDEDYIDQEELEDNLAYLEKMCLIDKINKKRVSVQLEDEHGDPINLKDVFIEVNDWVRKQIVDKEDNTTRKQIYPLVAQGLVIGLPKYAGSYYSSIILATEALKYTFLHQMTVMLYFYQFVKKNNLKIITVEEQISDEEIERLERLDKASSVTALATLAGADSKEVLRAMLKAGQITQEDINSLGVDLSKLPQDKKDPGDKGGSDSN